jgi:hypothetical protein
MAAGNVDGLKKGRVVLNASSAAAVVRSDFAHESLDS